jgi:hypothetical protein
MLESTPDRGLVANVLGAVMSSCILCGQELVDPPPEHAIPQWARREFDIQGKVTIDARADERGPEQWPVDALQHLNITLDDAICKDCNTVWLNFGLERPLQPVLAPMAGRAKPTVLSSALQALSATWAVKTVYLLELAIRQKYPDARPVPGYLPTAQELAWLRQHKEPPPRSRVWLGCWDCQRETPVMYAPSSAPLPTVGGTAIEGHFTTLALGYITFQVFTVDFIAAEQHGARDWNAGPPPSIRVALPQIWPPQSDDVRWPPPAFPNDQWARLVTWDDALRTGID